MRAVQIGFGDLTIVTSIFALVFPGSTYISVVWVFAVRTVLRWNRESSSEFFHVESTDGQLLDLEYLFSYSQL